MGTVAEGARQAVENCVGLNAGEKVLIITDKQTSSVADAVREVAEEITKDIKTVIMEDLGERPVNWNDSLDEDLKQADVSFYIAGAAQGELQTFRMPMLKTVETAKKVRHAHMIGITEAIMKDGMCTDYREIQRISELVYEKVCRCADIRVLTEAGTDFTAHFLPILRWHVANGIIRKAEFNNLPDGEVFTCPATVDGKIVVDGCLGDFFAEKFGSIEKTPVTIEMKDGRAIRESVRCDNKELEKELVRYLFESDTHSARVGEFAIGTNVGLRGLIGNMLQDEKYPGIHIAFGDPYGNKTGADWTCKSHLDCVTRETTILVDGETLMSKGEFKL